ncbi:bifunctional phosphopantothenoylcysteine decarboxylase/phosphopantothenate--cysteine ligase CoaBC [Calderihabitans maritimus]|uniref:Coenzyme A biosynthesis bifunctional protein CoaBC n=1 Tax=Calderihabitans maritimus TaxID=1246530 RepID=A0A1Z5HWP5_9FIRM|nr:bifunctional phosphopantothenoylcysteine decarboxylase/phosphopantothenate--cysteine ligase CoaBC [Calderihabitans maritimus]GAW93953.1 peptidase ClpP [Calderihabitans maritimus]
MLAGKTVVVGITGSIAAYKAAELVSRLRKLHAKVHVAMSKSATRFIQPLTLRTLSQNPVIVDMFEEPAQWNVAHVSVAEKADLIVVAPATANIIAKMANGIADEFILTTILASKCPVVIAPAMNDRMYQHPVVQANMARLKELGYHFVEPETGLLACGSEGKGRLAEVERIIDRIVELLETGRRDLAGKTVLVTAGGTREAIDPVRYLGNRSSGKMGYAIAEAARMRGADVILVTAPTALPLPTGVEVIQVESAREMFEAVLKCFPRVDIVVKAAAVADYSPVRKSSQKIKKTKGALILELTPNPDILLELGRRKEKQILVGFAAETEELLANAERKMKEKNLDMIVANDVTCPETGFGSDFNKVTLVFPDGRTKELPLLPKKQVAMRILDEVVMLPRFSELK